MNNLMKILFIAFVASFTVAGGACDTHSFNEEVVVLDAPLFVEEAVNNSTTTERTGDYWGHKVPQISGSTARGRRASRHHRERISKKRSRLSSYLPQTIWAKLSNQTRESVIRRAKMGVRAQLLGQWAKRVALLGGFGMVLLAQAVASDLNIGSAICGLAGIGLLAGTVDDSKVYHELHKGLVASEESVSEWAQRAALIKDKRSFKQAKFANKVESTLKRLDAHKAQLAVARADVAQIMKSIADDPITDVATDGRADSLDKAHANMNAANDGIANILVELDDLLDTSSAVEAMSVVKADTHNVDSQIFVTNVQKETCSFEIEGKFPNDYGQSNSACMETLAMHIKKCFAEAGITQHAHTGDYSATSVRDIVVSVDGSLNNEVAYEPSHEDMYFEENGYIFCTEIKTPVWTVERATKRLPILMDALKSFRITGGSADGGDGARGFVDQECGQHIHIGVFSLDFSGGRRREWLQNIERKIAMREELTDKEWFFINWMSAIVINYDTLQPTINQMMHHTRSGGECYYSNPVHNYAESMRGAYRLRALATHMKPEYAVNADGEMCEVVWKQMWTDFVEKYTITMEESGMGSRTSLGYLEATLRDWDSSENIPDELDRVLSYATNAPAARVMDMIAAERGAGDGGSYPNVNMGALMKHGTVEFRQQGGLLNYDAQLAWLYFLHSLVALSMGGMKFAFKDGLDRKEKIAACVEMSQHAVERMEASTAKANDLFKHLGMVEDGVLPEGWADWVTQQNPLVSRSNKWRDFRMISIAGVMPLFFTGVNILTLVVAAICLIVQCGIGGLVKLRHNKNLTRREAFGLRKILPVELGSRGRQSIGVAMFENGSGRVRKAARPRSEKDSYTTSWGRGWSKYSEGSDMPAVAGPLLVEALAGSRDHRDYTADAWFVHTRFATHGAVNEKNAHPMQFGNITLMHNGVVSNDQQIREFAESDDWHPEGTREAQHMVGNETDTLAIAMMLNYTGSDNDGVELSGTVLDGTMRIAWVDEREKLQDDLSPRVHLWSNTSDLWFAETENGNVVWASEKEILEDAFGDFKPTDGGRNRGTCLKKGSIFPAQVGAHYVIDYDFGLINLGMCGKISTQNANAWRGGTKTKKTKDPGNFSDTKKAAQSKNGEVMVTETKGGVTTIKPLSQVEACSSPAKDCGVPADTEGKWEADVQAWKHGDDVSAWIDLDQLDGHTYIWDEDAGEIKTVKMPVCACGISESDCANCVDGDADGFMAIGLEGEQLTLQEASRILTEGDWTEDEAEFVAESDEQRGLVQQVIDAEMAEHLKEQADAHRENIEGMNDGDLIEYIADNIEAIDYNTLDPVLKDVYDAYMDAETQSG